VGFQQYSFGSGGFEDIADWSLRHPDRMNAHGDPFAHERRIHS
jgi:hypothetical protein